MIQVVQEDVLLLICSLFKEGPAQRAARISRDLQGFRAMACFAKVHRARTEMVVLASFCGQVRWHWTNSSTELADCMLQDGDTWVKFM